MVTQNGHMPTAERYTNAAHTNILSASGSISFPKFVTKLYFLAKYPSRKSLMAPMMNAQSATHEPMLSARNHPVYATASIGLLPAVTVTPSIVSDSVNTITSRIREIVMVFGKFSMYVAFIPRILRSCKPKSRQFDILNAFSDVICT